jgi:DNA repair protein RadC
MNCANSIEPNCISSPQSQLSVPDKAITPFKSNFAYVYRVCLVKDHSISFGESSNITNPSQAQAILKHLILTRGQTDREQLLVAMLNCKNDLIGFNIVSVGSLSHTTVQPCGVLKPAILANAASIIMCHNHPSGDPQPSEEDRLLTRTIIQAADIIGIRVLEHLIITMENDRYFSFADQGLIAKTYSEVGRGTIAHRIVDHLFQK